MKCAAGVLPCLDFWAHSHSFRRFGSCCSPPLSSLHAEEAFPSAKSSLLSLLIKAHRRLHDLIAENRNLGFNLTLFPPLLFCSCPRRRWGGSVGRQSLSLPPPAEGSLPPHWRQEKCKFMEILSGLAGFVFPGSACA